MRRPYLFWSGLPLASKLQFFAVGLILGYWLWIDFQFGLLKLALPIAFAMLAVSRLLLPLMMAHPERAQQVLNGFGLATFAVWLIGRDQMWGRLIVTHLGLTAAMWLDLGCWFWFVSEIKLREERLLRQLTELRLSSTESLDEDFEGNAHVETDDRR